ncbi:MAG: Sulfite reductase [NADPH] flavoprotein alpha-component [Chlamydiia bacterium]|nr:Sulfite reductase [NADPH] flavoprotein alpha-component [Chlamydiia bacterium]MCH9618406.1 Sulfite reductase [NADPH] flavoprotein alpha-component [Chlamydiia bacterium]MCH9623732.1 Sulfite reductase [NADPH] flavoprotein alpha-component [Chlamydiia bacterium]
MNSNIKYTIKNPYHGKITKVLCLNKEGSTKCNYHVEISLEGSGIHYEVGSSFGLLPENSKQEVERLIAALLVSPDLLVSPKKLDFELPLSDFFLNYVNLHRVTKKIATALLPLQTDDGLETLLNGEWKKYTENHDLIEFLETYYQKKLPVAELVDLVSPMLARFYSVASSQNIVKDNLQLLVADFCYTKGIKKHKSITARHLIQNKTIRLFHQQNPSFQPPKEDTPVIMIGPGTGLAAFLGFIQERILFRKCNNNILFTGDRHKEYDFYYEEELKKYEEQGSLKLFTAFSRDTDNKVYVQHRIWEQKELIFDLIETKNAQIFISGDAHKMAKDVVATFEKIFVLHKKLSHQEAHALVKSLIKEKRLHLDVY